MKKQVLSAAIAAVSLLGFSQASFALAPTTTPDLEIFMSGASAQDKAIAALFNNLCNAGTLDVFKDNDKAGSEGKSHTAYFCTLSSTNVPGLSVNGAPVASANVLFHKRSAGGSAQGVNPLIDGVAIAAMRIDNGNCTLNSGNVWFCNAQGANLTNQVSDAGISDVEPKLFIGPNKPSNAGAVDPAAADAALTVDAAAALLFGVPVSDNLYVALQQAQGLMTGFGGSCAAGEYTEACMPSLSRQQVAELVSGQIKRWSEFKVNGVALTSLVSGTYDSGDGVLRNVAPTDTKVHFCKRIDGSGTGAQMYAKFLNNPCSSAGLSPDWTGSSLAGPVKHEVSGSGDMELCLEDFADGESNAKQVTSTNPDVFNTTVNGSGAKAWAIGMQSTENNATHSKHYRFIKVDGVAPTLENAFRGKYMDWVEQTYQWRNAISQDKKTIIQKIAADAGSPSILGTVLNPGFVQPFGAAGYLAVGTKHAFTDTLNLAAPVMPYSHSAKGSLSNCQVPVIPSSTNTSKPM
ncbi:hypothetical protein [Methylomonas methanica]|uniref:PBP domain-containing protein n=1 Tax=Methylomonas methanica (strain DSM 25384 / MC09) TaxID=857087 RepID=G0A764_METMM|nr:hypothetical protein [Methylomonas methanica]AEF99357.1 hypothetical protein Metme_0919 [Methylomonas methanica MC09]